ncbi:thrombospondin type 3 repeat-containing protein, partial [Arenibacter sp. F20364]|uniref:thrombospondin type 3 repeat-containing protein n=1 Tax=Arenibacter sp. F20364 TaxID=2926415 RepID=UPI001FF3E433
MENITFVKYRKKWFPNILLIAVFCFFGNMSSYADVPKNVSSKLDGIFTVGYNVDISSKVEGHLQMFYWSPFSVNFLYAKNTTVLKTEIFETYTKAVPPTDSDGDGVTNDKEHEDGTDPNNPCDFILAHQNCAPSSNWKNADCDGDGVTNEKEKEDGTDPLDPCDFVLAHQNCSPSTEWKNADCDGDGVT